MKYISVEDDVAGFEFSLSNPNADIEETWTAACKYKDKEIEKLKKQIRDLEDRVNSRG